MKHLPRHNWDTPRDPNKLWLDRNECNCLETRQLIKSIHESVDYNRLSTYPSLGSCYTKLAEFLHIKSPQLLLTCGADGAVRQFFQHNRGGKALLMRPTYAMNDVYAHYYMDEVMHIDYPCTKEDIFDAITHLYYGDIFVLASPDSPVGIQYTIEELWAIADLCKWQGVKLLIDETYILFGNRDHTMIPFVDDTVSVCHSFSKSLGLAGVRLGYLVTKDQSMKDNKPMKEIGDYQAAILEGALDNIHTFLHLIDKQIELRNELASHDGFDNTPCNFVHANKSKVDKLKKIAYIRENSHPYFKDSVRLTLPDRSCIQNIINL